MSELPQVITADCSSPKEIDDGLYVHKLDEERELYEVGVCVADTSSLYKKPEIVSHAHDRTAAKYWELPGNERGYDPMIDADEIKNLELIEGSVRSALVISFLIGPKDEPEDVSIAFKPVEIVSNKTYKQFANEALSGELRHFLRVSSLIKNHLGYIAYGDHAGVRPAWRNGSNQVISASDRAWKKGSQVNESFMVAANHLVGRQMATEGRPAIYRVHDPEDEQYLELLSASVARYSRIPGPHSGLRLDPYCRVTSPLRRLDDFVMNNQLRKRFEGKQPTAQDTREVAFAIRRLNQELIAAAPKDVSKFSRRDILGRLATSNATAIEAS